MRNPRPLMKMRPARQLGSPCEGQPYQEKETKMTRRLIGLILVGGAAMLTVALVMGGKLIFPHVTGPITLAVIGTILLTGKGMNTVEK